MMKYIIKIVMILLLSMGYLSAKDRQFYFIGKYDRLGSLSSDASSKKGVYLRWDMIEGDLPSDIETLKLIRIYNDANTTLLSNIPAHNNMTADTIKNMYIQYGSERRLFETVDFISNNTNPDCTGANISNIGTKVAACLSDNYWAFLASRVNFDVARARYRAFLDLDVTENMVNVQYVLLGSNATQSMVLGKTTVNLQSTDVLPAADFSQVFESKCNDGRYALDDYRVALRWKNGGDRTNFFANGLMVSGYDIYYSTQTVEKLPGDFARTDIASLAASLPHNAKGNIDMTNHHLKKANDTLITLGGQAGEDGKPIYVEKQADLKTRGFKPGEKRYYFLVPRDFTGNYGPTQSLVVEIPDKLPPPMPVNPRAVEQAGKFALMWDNLTLKNYAAHYEDVMKVCSTATYKTGDRVQFVDLDESCVEGRGITVNFNIAKYYIYRFDNIQDAASFTDSDLDGYADNIEEEMSSECNVDLFPKNKDLNRLVGVIENEGQEFNTFTDTNVDHSKVYWYRIVSATENDISSPLTAPVRAFMPKREVLPAPEITVEGRSYLIAELKSSTNEDVVASDLSDDQNIDTVKVELNGIKYELLKDNNFFILTDEIRNRHFANVNTPASVYFYSNGEVLKHFDFMLTDVFTMHLIKDDEENVYAISGTHHNVNLKTFVEQHVDGGSTYDKCLTIKYSDDYYQKLQQRGGHIETSMRIGLGRYHQSTEYSPQQETEICTDQAKKGDLISYRMIECLDNGICSQPVYINKILLDDVTVPNTPTVIKLNINKDDLDANVAFVPQLEKVKGTMLLLYNQKDVNRSYTKIVPHIGNKSVNPIDESIDLAEVSVNETWCLKGKTIGLNGKVSEWSAPLCQEILEEEQLPPEMLGWPAIANIKRATKDFAVYFDVETKKIEITLDTVNMTYHDHYKVQELPRDLPDDVIAEVNGEENAIQKLSMILYDDEDEPMTEKIIIEKNADEKFILPLKLGHLGEDDLVHIKGAFFSFMDVNDQELFNMDLEDPLFEPGSNENDEQATLVTKAVQITVSKMEDECALMSTINKVSNFVVYRQTLHEDNTKSNFVQISPLIEGGSCENNDYSISNNLMINDLGDDSSSIGFIDKYPYVIGEKYQYMILFFDRQSKEMKSYSLTYPNVLETY